MFSKHTASIVALTGMCATFALGFQTAAKKDDGAVTAKAASEIFASRCSTCHVAPDLAYATDRAWVEQVNETAWTDTPKAARAALIEFFKSEALARPAIAANAGAAGASITASFDEGSILLRNSDDAIVRLAWEARGDEPRHAAKSRTLPAGQYRMVGYRIVDRSRPDEIWHLSGGGLKLRKIEVPATGEVRIDIAAKVSVKQRFDGGSAGFEIRGADAAGVSIYKDGKRIPIGYRLLDEKGRELAQGKMNYGWGGGGWASLEPKRAGARFELVYEKPPFVIEAGGL